MEIKMEHKNERKVIDIEWACEWLKENADNYYESSCQSDDCYYNSELMIEDFRKAMVSK